MRRTGGNNSDPVFVVHIILYLVFLQLQYDLSRIYLAPKEIKEQDAVHAQKSFIGQ
jgi:hypothetical protein